MKISTDLTPAEFSAILTKFVSLVGSKKLEGHLDSLHEQSKSLAGSEYVGSRYWMELALHEILQYRKRTGRILWDNQSKAHYRLFSFMCVVVRAHLQLSPVGRRNLEGALRKSLDQAYGFGSLSFEMLLAAHLMSKGYDLQFTDMENQERFDYLATKGADIIEFECKFVSEDIGRKIHRKKFHQLAEFLKPVIDKNSEDLRGGIFVQIELEDRLHGSIEEFKKIGNLLKKVLTEGGNSSISGVSASRHLFDQNTLPFERVMSKDRLINLIRNFAKQVFGEDNHHVMAHGKIKEKLILVSIKSKQKDEVLSSIYRKHLRDATNQLSGTRPGIICLYFPDLKENELTELAKVDSGLAMAVNLILMKRPDLYGVVLMTSGEITRRESSILIAPTMTSESGPAVVYRNPAYSSTLEYDLFERVFS